MNQLIHRQATTMHSGATRKRKRSGLTLLRLQLHLGMVRVSVSDRVSDAVYIKATSCTFRFVRRKSIFRREESFQVALCSQWFVVVALSHRGATVAVAQVGKRYKRKGLLLIQYINDCDSQVTTMFCAKLAVMWK